MFNLIATLLLHDSGLFIFCFSRIIANTELKLFHCNIIRYVDLY